MEGDCLCEAGDAVCVCLSVFVCPDVPDEEWPDDVAVLFHEVFEGDDASVVEAAGYRVSLVDGERQNIKLTTPEDVEYAEWILSRE